MLILLKSKHGKRHSSYIFNKKIQLTGSIHKSADGWTGKKKLCSQGEKAQKAADQAVQALLSGQPEAKWQAKGH